MDNGGFVERPVAVAGVIAAACSDKRQKKAGGAFMRACVGTGPVELLALCRKLL